MTRYNIIQINATMNNTIINITDEIGHVHVQQTGGKVGYKKGKRGTSYTGQIVMTECMRQFMGMSKNNKFRLILKGMGPGRDGALKHLTQLHQKRKIHIIRITEQTPIPHNGCRPPSTRRI